MFMKLLANEPENRITVKQMVDECGINLNTFNSQVVYDRKVDLILTHKFSRNENKVKNMDKISTGGTGKVTK